jgi:hypothetical protein
MCFPWPNWHGIVISIQCSIEKIGEYSPNPKASYLVNRVDDFSFITLNLCKVGTDAPRT